MFTIARTKRPPGPRRRSTRALALGLVATLAACTGAPGRVILTITDEAGLASAATVIAVGADPEALDERPRPERDFPLTVTLEGPSGEERRVWVEARADDRTMARAFVDVTFPRDKVGALAVALRAPCDDDAACDDGVYCNGAERCLDRVCHAAAPACAPSSLSCVDVSCDEAASACVITPVHARCEPLDDGIGGQEPTYCDARIGCVPGASCDVEGAECPRLDPCDPARTCISGRCVPGERVDVDDDNPCTRDFCDVDTGVTHYADPALDGSACPLDGGGLGVCVGGACGASVCGDGYVDAARDEECDTGAARSDSAPDACRLDCRAARCGDGVLDDGEDCDDGNATVDDACVACRVARCGDGVVEAGVEECDDGNDDETDACTNTCTDARCGDGIVWAGVETCDDANVDDDDACRASCVPNICGDGAVNAEAEECDDGNASNLDGCLVGCVRNTCGDGFLDPATEECDDQNTIATDDCLPGCIENVCGDGVRDTTEEECDDGDALDTNYCLTSCQVNVCGDGALFAGVEACDDGNDVDTDACRLNCTVNVCGDGVRYIGVEGCDDGNASDADACRTDCQPNVCGDGVVNPGAEACDDGNVESGDGCSGECSYVLWSTSPVIDTGLVAQASVVADVDSGIVAAFSSGHIVRVPLSGPTVLVSAFVDVGVAAPLLLDPPSSRLIVVGGDGSVHAFDHKSLAPVYVLPPATAALGSSVAKAGKSTFMVVDSGGEIHAFTLADGAEASFVTANGTPYAKTLGDGSCVACGPSTAMGADVEAGLVVTNLGPKVTVWDVAEDCDPAEYTVPAPDGAPISSFAVVVDEDGLATARDAVFFVTTAGVLTRASLAPAEPGLCPTSFTSLTTTMPGAVTAPSVTFQAPTYAAVVMGSPLGRVHRRDLVGDGTATGFFVAPGWPDTGVALSGAPAHAPVLVGKDEKRATFIVIGTSAGFVDLVDMDGAELVASIPVGAAVVGPPVVVDKAVVVATADGRLHAIETPLQASRVTPAGWARPGRDNRGSAQAPSCAAAGDAPPVALAVALCVVAARRRRRR